MTEPLHDDLGSFAPDPPLKGGHSGHLMPVELVWAVLSLHKAIEALNNKWASSLGISGPQWLLLLAIKTLDAGHGVGGTEVAKKMRVDPSFVSAQVTLLARKGLMSRAASASDGRVVLLSLSKKALRAFEEVQYRESSLNKFIFSKFSDQQLLELVNSCEKLSNNYSKALHFFELHD